MKSTKEWAMVVDLYRIKNKIKEKNQRNFIEGLYELLDEFQPILDQQSEAQVDYLYSLYSKYITKK